MEQQLTDGMMKDVITLISGTAVAQIITIIATPVITRVYDPSAFGIYAVFISLTGIIGSIACLSYESSIMLPESDKDAANQVRLCLVILIAITSLLAVILWLFGGFIMFMLNTPQLTRYTFLIPVSVFLTGLVTIFTYWVMRKKKFRLLSITRMAGSGSTACCQIGLGHLGQPTAGGLIESNILGLVVTVTSFGAEIRREFEVFSPLSLRWSSIVAGSKRYRDFPLYYSWSVLLSSVSIQLPTILFATLFSAAIVGYYSISMNVLLLPVILIGTATSQAFFQRGAAAILKSKGALASLVEEITDYLVRLSFFPTLIVILIGWEGFTIILGPAGGKPVHSPRSSRL